MNLHYPNNKYPIYDDLENNKSYTHYILLCNSINDLIYKFKKDLEIVCYGYNERTECTTFGFIVSNFNKNRNFIKWYFNNGIISYPILQKNNSVLLTLNC